MKTLYITDLDGTLLNNNGKVPPVTAEIISDLSHRGAMISVATARTPATVEKLLGNTYTTAELVVMTGASLWDRPRHRFVDMHLIPEDDVLAMLDVFSTSVVKPFCYTLHGDNHLDVYHAAEKLSAAESLFVDQRQNLELKTFHLASQFPSDSCSEVVLFFGMGPKQAIISLAKKLWRVTDCYVSYYKDTYTPNLWFLEIFAPGVSKAAGIERLRKRVKADRVVAFGDNLNDIPMLNAADVAVAVDNALPDVKDLADVVIGPNTADSVARFIMEDFLHGPGREELKKV